MIGVGPITNLFLVITFSREGGYLCLEGVKTGGAGVKPLLRGKDLLCMFLFVTYVPFDKAERGLGDLVLYNLVLRDSIGNPARERTRFSFSAYHIYFFKQIIIWFY